MTGHCVEIPAHLKAVLPQDGFTDTTVLVIGDLMLDRYIIGEATRISPEAPVPIVAVNREKVAAGGAGNVALNIAGLRAKAMIAGVVGNDVTGSILTEVLKKSGVDACCLVEDTSRPTTCKTRVMCGSHQLVRFDEEAVSEIDSHVTHKLRERIVAALNTGVKAVILSDYAKGVLNTSLTRFAITECLNRNIPIFVDPKRADYSLYAEATCLTPNLKEFQTALHVMLIPDHGIAATAQVLREKLSSPMLLITQGSQGMTLVASNYTRHFPALAEEVFDVSGAGDTVIATFATAVAAGLSSVAAVELSNIAASVVVRKIGTAPILWEDLNPFFPSASKTVDPLLHASLS